MFSYYKEHDKFIENNNFVLYEVLKALLRMRRVKMV